TASAAGKKRVTVGAPLSSVTYDVAIALLPSGCVTRATIGVAAPLPRVALPLNVAPVSVAGTLPMSTREPSTATTLPVTATVFVAAYEPSNGVAMTIDGALPSRDTSTFADAACPTASWPVMVMDCAPSLRTTP